ncbi:hypothetical protein ABR759_08895 [Escherichia coli]
MERQVVAQEVAASHLFIGGIKARWFIAATSVDYMPALLGA